MKINNGIFIIEEENHLLRIDEMFAFITTDKKGNEGVAAYYSRELGGMLPMVGADMARVESLKPKAQEVARLAGCRVRLVRFSKREELEVIE